MAWHQWKWVDKKAETSFEKAIEENTELAINEATATTFGFAKSYAKDLTTQSLAKVFLLLFPIILFAMHFIQKNTAFTILSVIYLLLLLNTINTIKESIQKHKDIYFIMKKENIKFTIKNFLSTKIEYEIYQKAKSEVYQEIDSSSFRKIGLFFSHYDINSASHYIASGISKISAYVTTITAIRELPKYFTTPAFALAVYVITYKFIFFPFMTAGKLGDITLLQSIFMPVTLSIDYLLGTSLHEIILAIPSPF